MLRLRPYKSSDAAYLIEWLEEERTFAAWCADRFEYPLTLEQIEQHQELYEQDSNAWSFLALDKDGKPVGYFLMRNADYEKERIHLGFIVIDTKMRGRGYGKEMVALAVKYAFEILQVNLVTLSVFCNNKAAYHCYKSIGFCEKNVHLHHFQYKGESWSLSDMEINRKEFTKNKSLLL